MKPALFLDRDGVINVDHGYVSRPEDFEFTAGAFQLARAGAEADWPVIVVTNQSGIARGFYSEQEFCELTAWMVERFRAEGARIAGVYHCPHHPEGSVDAYRADHDWRKPKPGMFLAARDDLGVDLQRSIMVGDQGSDIEAAAAAKVPVRILVRSAYQKPSAAEPTHQVASTVEAAALVRALIQEAR
ncbi:D-alpha,beta-D-heptose 1,7-bisphosphate phosphatase [Rhodoblastus acidophilus]|uniref:D,D-heptose 1,7-bisphosphate phosphatase n=1 Tax=Rhodoblastus acidophilus TaxID=1074 RepID=A0A212QHQ0_RHOAC|nr:HAD family hydrolase [Rhodoblastus acidophilus]PPQ40115.1 HAD family hydrolase [Rhodoblastus acidophilus]RAI22356.1 HAD family hydrolase [Rhodoblastus acidophilus]SNB58884.1 D-alpha,beta-D-heptose 1,7-bisphosphate phosphatase [Rhodoblastus acidophilus]